MTDILQQSAAFLLAMFALLLVLGLAMYAVLRIVTLKNNLAGYKQAHDAVLSIHRTTEADFTAFRAKLVEAFGQHLLSDVPLVDQCVALIAGHVALMGKMAADNVGRVNRLMVSDGKGGKRRETQTEARARMAKNPVKASSSPSPKRAQKAARKANSRHGR